MGNREAADAGDGGARSVGFTAHRSTSQHVCFSVFQALKSAIRIAQHQ